MADRASAERLTNTRLYVERARLPEPEPDEFYLVDLVGLAASDADGRADRHGERGARLRRRREPGDRREHAPPLLVPFTRACVPVVDIAARPPDSGTAGRTAGRREHRRQSRPRRSSMERSHDLARLRPDAVPGACSRGRWRIRWPAARCRPASGRCRQSTSATSPPTGIAPWTTRRSAAAPAWCCARTWSMQPSPRSPMTARWSFLTPRGRRLTQQDVRRYAGGAGMIAALRPLRRHRPARHRGARHGGDQHRRLRAVRRRAGGARAARRHRAPAARASWAPPRAPARSRSRITSWNTRTTPARPNGRGGACPKSCSRAIMQAVAAWRRAEAERVDPRTPPRPLGSPHISHSRRAGCQCRQPRLKATRYRRTTAMNVIQRYEAEQIARLTANRAVPDFAPGDTVRVAVKVVEGERTRTQAFEGVCIGRSNQGTEQQLHRSQDQLRRRRGARVPALFAVDRRHRRDPPRRRAARQAVLPARPVRQTRPHRRARAQQRGRGAAPQAATNETTAAE